MRVESPFVEAHLNSAVVLRTARAMRAAFIRHVVLRVVHRIGRWIHATPSLQPSEALP
jgi:hypothetical protein